jgi:hypothetical protein
MQTIVTGTTGTSGMASVTAIFENLSGQFWDGSAWVTFNNSNLASYKTAATERGTLAQYAATIPAGAREEWSTAYFLDSTNQTVATATKEVITNTTLADDSMLELTAARFGGVTPTRDGTTGTETYKREDGTSAYTETPSTTAATRTIV